MLCPGRPPHTSHQITVNMTALGFWPLKPTWDPADPRRLCWAAEQSRAKITINRLKNLLPFVDGRSLGWSGCCRALCWGERNPPSKYRWLEVRDGGQNWDLSFLVEKCPLFLQVLYLTLHSCSPGFIRTFGVWHPFKVCFSKTQLPRCAPFSNLKAWSTFYIQSICALVHFWSDT